MIILLRNAHIQSSILLFIVLLLGCSASRGSQNYTVNTEGIVEAQVIDMNKDAVRLKGETLSKGTQVKDRRQYEFKVIEIIQYGSTFASVEPQVGEKVLLLTLEEVKFNKGTKVILDALTPLTRGDGQLVINMVNE